jgi:iron complex outermembrane receptor protein
MSSHRAALLLRTRLSAGLLATSFAFAPANAAATASAPDAAAAASEADDAGEGQEVLVTARRRNERLQDVPISVTAIGGAVLQRDNTNFIMKISEKVPSLTAYWSNPKQVLVGIRGIGSNAGNNDGLDPSVGVFVDGVYLARNGQLGFSGNFEDLQSLDVLRGPQGTLFGKNTTAGAILIQSNKPTFDFEGSAEAVVGNYGLKTVRGVVSGPLIDDKLAIRVSAYDNTRHGTEKNVTLGNRLNSLDNRGFRAQLLATPTEALDIRIVGSYDAIGQSPQPTAFIGDGPTRTGTKPWSQRVAALGYTPINDPFSYEVYQNARHYSKANQTAISGEINWDLGGVKLTSITGYRHYYFYPYNDFDATPLNISPDFGSSNKLDQYSQELRLGSNPGSTVLGQNVDWVVGLYTFHQSLDVFYRYEYGADQYYFSTPPAGTTPASFQGVKYGYNADLKIHSYAGFGQATWHLTPKLELTGGIRQTWEKKSAETTQFVLNQAGLTQAQIASVFGVTFGTSGGSVSSSNLSFGGSASYKILPDLLTYASYSRGYKSAAANIGVFSAAQVAAGATPTIPGEKADAWEVGVKSHFGPLTVNIDGFYTKVSNYQTTIQAVDYRDPANPRSVSFLGTAGGLKTKGIEVEGSLHTPIPGLDLSGAASYVDATYGTFSNAPCPPEVAAALPATAVCVFDQSGQRVEQIPHWTGNVTAAYETRITDRVRGYGVAQYSYRSSTNLASGNSRYGQIDGFGLANFRLGAKFGERVDVSLFVNNAFKEKYFINQITVAVNGPVRATPGDPRTFGGSAKFRF